MGFRHGSKHRCTGLRFGLKPWCELDYSLRHGVRHGLCKYNRRRDRIWNWNGLLDRNSCAGYRATASLSFSGGHLESQAILSACHGSSEMQAVFLAGCRISGLQASSQPAASVLECRLCPQLAAQILEYRLSSQPAALQVCSRHCRPCCQPAGTAPVSC